MLNFSNNPGSETVLHAEAMCSVYPIIHHGSGCCLKLSTFLRFMQEVQHELLQMIIVIHCVHLMWYVNCVRISYT